MNTKSFTDKEIRLPYPIAITINTIGGSWIPLVGLVVAAAIILSVQQCSNNKESEVGARLEVTQKGD